jgi:hypothetical protein
VGDSGVNKGVIVDQESFTLTRRTQSRLLVLSLTLASQRLIVGNPKRVALRFGNPATDPYWFAPGRDVAAGQGFVMTATKSAEEFCVFHHGDAVRGPWFLISTVGAQTVVVLETEYAEEMPPPEIMAPAQRYAEGVKVLEPRGWTNLVPASLPPR